MAGAQASAEEVLLKTLRSCLITEKNGMSLHSLSSLYNLFEGKSIPFRQMGYTDLADLLRKNPSVARIGTVDGKTWAWGVNNAETMGIASLVGRSRPKKKRKGSGRGRGRGSSYSGTRGGGRSTAYGYVGRTSRTTPSYTSSVGRFAGPRYPPTRHVQQISNYQPAPRMRQQVVAQQFQPPGQDTRTLPPKSQPLQPTQNRVPPSGDRVSNMRSKPVLEPTENRAGCFSNGVPKSSNSVLQQSPNCAPNAVQRTNSTPVFQPTPNHALSNNTVQRVNSTPLPIHVADHPSQFLQPKMTASSYIKKVNERKMEAKAALEEYVKEMRLEPPITKIVPAPLSIGHIGTLEMPALKGKLTTYPHVCPSPDNAIAVVCKLALQQLEEKEKERKRGFSLNVTIEENLIVERVKKILSLHAPCSSLFGDGVCTLYEDCYNERLPHHWLKVIQEQAKDSIESDEGTGRPILWLGNQDAYGVMQVYASDESGGDETSVGDSDEVESDLSRPPPLILENVEENVDVVITAVINGATVAVRIIGEKYNDQYVDMTEVMDEYYEGNAEKAALPLTIGGYYAAKMDEGWHRVEFVADNKDETCKIWLADHGDQVDIPENELYILHEQFFTLPCQSIMCHLHHLNGLLDNARALEELTDLIGKSLVATIVSTHPEEQEQIAVTVLLHDTSSTDDVCINYEILKEVAKTFAPINMLALSFSAQNAYVTNANGEGQVWLVPRVDIDVIEIISILCREEMKKVSEVDYESTACVVNIKDQYYRGLIVNGNLKQAMVEVQLIDRGGCEMVLRSDLKLLSKDSFLCNIPEQSVQCQLEGVTAVDLVQFRHLVPDSKHVLVKFIHRGRSLASVRLFRLSDTEILHVNMELATPFNKQKQNDLSVAVNGHMTSNFGQLQIATNKNCLSNGGKPSSQTSPSSITKLNTLDYNKNRQSQIEVPGPVNYMPRQEFPNSGYYDVHVSLAASPSNFVVQSWTEGFGLQRLLKDMTDYYESQEKDTKIDVVGGFYYAAKWTDGKWYRVRVQQVLIDGSATVYLIDYGDFNTVSADDIRYLQQRFCDLPAQAVQAKLAGIKPRYGDWSFDDCIRFQKLVVNRSLVSVVCGLEPDQSLVGGVPVVLLKLTDTSESGKDVHVDQVLIDEGRGVRQEN